MTGGSTRRRPKTGPRRTLQARKRGRCASGLQRRYPVLGLPPLALTNFLMHKNS